eukprot:9492947-Alexandrium_andersonii.AAC.1
MSNKARGIMGHLCDSGAAPTTGKEPEKNRFANVPRIDIAASPGERHIDHSTAECLKWSGRGAREALSCRGALRPDGRHELPHN